MFLNKSSTLVYCLTVTLIFAATNLLAQGTIRADQKYIEAIKKDSSVTPLGVDSFGDNVDLSNGSVEFKWTDIDVPGNNSLPVRLQRSLVVEDKYLSGGADLGGFGVAGSIDLPYLKGTFSSSGGWQVAGANPNARCSMYASPPSYTNISSSDYWSGNWMHIPGAGDQAMLSQPATTLPWKSGSAPIVTKSFWTFTCLPSTQNGYPGEGFVAISPSGEKYHFDWVVTKNYSAFSKRYGNYAHSTAMLPRVVVYFLPTLVEDRFGNKVTYTYVGDKLQRINSSDGRFIQIDTWSGDNITSVSSSMGTWSYAYDTNSTTTTQPDGSHWKYTTTGDLRVEPTPSLPVYDPPPPNGEQPICPEPDLSSGDYGLSVTAPSGATAAYSFTVVRHHVSNVPRMCNSFIDDSLMSYMYLTIPNFSDTLTLVSKSINGPALPAMTWSYSYPGTPWPAFQDVCADPSKQGACPTTKTTEVSGPGNKFVRYTYGNMFNETTGQLSKVEEGSKTNGQITIARTTTYDYILDSEVSGQPFPDKVGSMGSAYLDNAASLLRPLKRQQISLDGRVFTASNTAFDLFGRPTQVTKSSTPTQ